MANLFSAATVDASYAHAGNGPVPGIKDDDGKWARAGHKRRVVKVGPREMATFSKLLDAEGSPSEKARLPALHSTELLSVMEKLASQPRRLRDQRGEYSTSKIHDETRAQRDGTIRRETSFPNAPEEWILSGPHFFVGNPLNKTPRRICKTNKAYDCIDLTAIPDDYLPRTNFVPACNPEEFRCRIPLVPWEEECEDSRAKPITGYFRQVNREMVGPASERTLIAAIVPKFCSHTFACVSTALLRNRALMDYHAICLSLPIDAYVKITGATHAHQDLISSFPIPLVQPRIRRALHLRASALNCLTTNYRSLWGSVWDDSFVVDRWTRTDRRLRDIFFLALRGNGIATAPSAQTTRGGRPSSR